MYDVVVVGAGPGGAVAGKRCAERGLRTLVLEKRRLPREKVCSGLVLGRLAGNLIAQEFGPIPEEIVLRHMDGIVLWMPGIGERRVAWPTPITWRKDLDYWMVQAAQATGAEVWDDALLRKITPSEAGSTLSLRRDGAEQDIEARCVIGADGAYSTVRRGMYPDEEFVTSAAYREWYPGSPHLDDGWVYVVFPMGEYRPNVWLCPKDDGFTFEGAGVKPVGGRVRALLRDAGWTETAPQWRDGCVSRAILFEHLEAGRFTPARGNILLVGDAAGFQFPISGEGIGTSLESALLAADAVVAHSGTGAAAEAYLAAIEPLLGTLRECYAEVAAVRAQTGEALLDAIAAAFLHSFEVG